MSLKSVDPVEVIYLFTALAIIVLVSYYLITWVRGLAYGEPEESPEILITDFQQLKSEGKLSEAEYDKVKESALESIDAYAMIREASGRSSSSAQPKQREHPLATTTTQPREAASSKVPEVSEVICEVPPEIKPSSAAPISLSEALARKRQKEAEQG